MDWVTFHVLPCLKSSSILCFHRHRCLLVRQHRVPLFVAVGIRCSIDACFECPCSQEGQGWLVEDSFAVRGVVVRATVPIVVISGAIGIAVIITSCTRVGRSVECRLKLWV